MSESICRSIIRIVFSDLSMLPRALRDCDERLQRPRLGTVAAAVLCGEAIYISCFGAHLTWCRARHVPVIRLLLLDVWASLLGHEHLCNDAGCSSRKMQTKPHSCYAGVGGAFGLCAGSALEWGDWQLLLPALC